MNLLLSPSEVAFAAFASYSPRGSEDLAVQSRNVCYGIKSDRGDMISKAVNAISLHASELVDDFLSPEHLLVPAPRSAPLTAGALWPSRRICEELIAAGHGKEIHNWLARTKPVTKSSRSAAGERPSAQLHVESIDCEASDMFPRLITVVDDVVTKGRTLYACAAILKERFPNAEVRTFALVRTLGFDGAFKKITDPCVGEISFNGYDTNRRP